MDLNDFSMSPFKMLHSVDQIRMISEKQYVICKYEIQSVSLDRFREILKKLKWQRQYKITCLSLGYVSTF